MRWSLFPLPFEMGFYPAAEPTQGRSDVLCPTLGLVNRKQKLVGEKRHGMRRAEPPPRNPNLDLVILWSS